MALYARIKIANHVSPEMHREVDRYIKDPNQTRSQAMKASDAMLLARQLIQSLPIVPTNERIFELAQEIEIGMFDDLGPIEDVRKNWESWQNRVREILQAQKILLAATNNFNTDYYAEAEKFINNIKNEKNAYDKVCNEIYKYVMTNKEYAVALAETAQKNNIFHKIDVDEIFSVLGININ